jgi:hypothetical protein
VVLQRVFRKPDDPEQEERLRRFRLNQIGRIVEGHVVELVETPPLLQPEHAAGMFSRRKTTPLNPGANGMRRLVRYTYSISGVTYETAQDVTGLEERLCLERLAAGQHASVKYDPSNPSNSILVADDWSGIG